MTRGQRWILLIGLPVMAWFLHATHIDWHFRRERTGGDGGDGGDGAAAGGAQGGDGGSGGSAGAFQCAIQGDAGTAGGNGDDGGTVGQGGV